ncbi:hypothetical protein [Pseudalkalibacillus caeni]|uniref:Uncharacterized protein n=1 Tax=Exobacillus caeni TaxID=2574798 RepID=A0A5R9F4Q0_9BACL|nr:hypothetical protein [Pseudalkalibacillus caeni]TLS37469.1 hypothetical protein FCL54_10000 [Pseudalkalibacillus caeni]
MKKKVKSIRGKQTPNLIGPECIEATKVYDWVVLTNRDKNKIQIPEECFTAIEDCRHMGEEVTATCEWVDSGAATTRCDIIREVPANIGVESAKLVTLSFHVHIRVQFFCDGMQICDFEVPVHFMDDVILCHPEGTTIDCNIFDVVCSVITSPMLGDMVIIDVSVCKDVQVTAPVKLEVEAKFCGPRQAIPVEEVTPTCPRFPLFPEQCPEFFPPDNCLCQGSASLPTAGDDGTRTILVRDNTGLSAVTGRLTLNTTICDQCTLSQSELSVQFFDFPQEEPTGEAAVDQSFTFVATEFNQPTCEDDTLTITGFGRFKLAGQLEQNATFDLTLDDTTNTVTLTIRELGSGFAGGILAILDGISVPNTNVEECERFEG